MLVNQAKSINLLPILAIVGIGLILTIPAISYGVFDAHDLINCHLKWSKHFAEQFWAGDMYPRWLLGMNSGLGSPTFFFYPPLPYYFVSLFHPLFPSDSQSWYQLSLSTSLALIASGFTAYIWLQSITAKKYALIASILYMALPYHVAIDLYYRFALAEYWTFVWIPLILFFSKKLINEPNIINVIGFAVSYALLILSHLPTLIMFSLVPISYVLVMTGIGKKRKTLIFLIVAMILGVGLSAIYWLPAMTTQKYISMDAITEGILFYGNNFLRIFYEGVFIEFRTYICIVTVLMTVLAYCSFRIARTNSLVNYSRESIYWLATAMIAFLMTLPMSIPLWSVLTPLQKIQFPWRFNTILLVATTALLALGISSLKKPINFFNKKSWFVGILLSASLLLSVVQIIPLLPFLPYKVRFTTPIIGVIIALILWRISSLKKPVNFYHQKTLVIGILLATSLLMSGGIVMNHCLFNKLDANKALAVSMDSPEYRPKWVSKELYKSDPISQLGKKSPKASVTTGQGSLLVEQWKPRKIVLQANATTDLWLTINQFYYPGWTAKLKGESRIIPVRPSEPEGLLRVPIPSGKHEVIVTLAAGVEERAGQITSAVSAVITLILFLIFWLRKAYTVNTEILR